MGPADGSFRRLHFGLARQAVEIEIVGAALIEIEKQMISKVCGANRHSLYRLEEHCVN